MQPPCFAVDNWGHHGVPVPPPCRLHVRLAAPADGGDCPDEQEERGAGSLAAAGQQRGRGGLQRGDGLAARYSRTIMAHVAQACTLSLAP
jgi:hypothetical protein